MFRTSAISAWLDAVGPQFGWIHPLTGGRYCDSDEPPSRRYRLPRLTRTRRSHSTNPGPRFAAISEGSACRCPLFRRHERCSEQGVSPVL
jgi:hypothetical protein